MSFNIIDYGAKAEESFLSTQAIQQAIDECSETGGGTVQCPRGVFTVGTIHLASNVNLHLEAGCVLKASPRRQDYDETIDFPEAKALPLEKVSIAKWIIAYGKENISITGRGCLDANCSAFIPLDRMDNSNKWDRSLYEWRPGTPLFVCNCRKVDIVDVEIRNATYWTIDLVACQQVRMRDLTIHSPRQTPNADGIAIESCSDVMISGCHIDTGDDAIVLHAGYDMPDSKKRLCENIVITNCILGSQCAGIRFTAGEGKIRACEISNTVIRDSRIGIHILGWHDVYKGSLAIQDIHFSNMYIEAEIPLMISGTHSPDGPIERIAFSNVTMKGKYCSYVCRIGEGAVRDITMRDVRLEFDATDHPSNASILDNEMKLLPKAYPFLDLTLPHALIFWGVEEIHKDNIGIQITPEDSSIPNKCLIKQ